jgi:hypothetical protein
VFRAGETAKPRRDPVGAFLIRALLANSFVVELSLVLDAELQDGPGEYFRVLIPHAQR